MFPMEAIAGSLFWVFVIGAFSIRMIRTRSSTLVLQKYFVGVHPLPPTAPAVEIVGRMQGVIAFVLSLMGFSPITRLTLAGSELRCESTSLFGQRLQLIPIRQVSNLAAGIHKPIGNLISAAVINVSGLSLSWTLRSFWPITVTLIVGIILVALYAVSKKFFVEIHSQGGPPISLLFKPNLLEGVPIDAESAMEVIDVIRDLVMASGTMRPGFAGSVATIAAEPVPSPTSLESSIPESDGAPFDASPFSFAQAEDEPAEILVELEDDEPAPASPEEHEARADAMLAESKQFAADGDRRRAVRLLKTIVKNSPNTKAAQQARRTLERSGIQP